MEATTIKKELYKQKPIAKMRFIRLGVAYYDASIEYESKTVNVEFQVPVADMGDTDFLPLMDAKLLNRYIVSL
jgi:hypothetical protein